MSISLGRGLPDLDGVENELEGYRNDLRRYYDPDEVTGAIFDLIEVATAYLARAYEIQGLLYQREQRLVLPRGCPEQRFRTGTLESFICEAKVLRDLGSRRLSYAQYLQDAERTGRE